MTKLEAVAPPTVNGIPEVLVGLPWRESRAFHFRLLDGRLSLRQGVALRFILDGLMQRGAKVGGAHVKGPMDAVRYVLEQIADEIGVSATGGVARGPADQ